MAVIPFLDLQAMHRPIADELTACWNDALERSAFIGGEQIERFEEDFAAYCCVRCCVGVGNGTDALELVLAASGIGRGSDVIVPANTFVATAEAVAAAGARVVFADVDPDTLLLTAETARAALTPATAAIIAVHLYGQPVDGAELRALADANGVLLIEDAAQAHGARWAGARAGSFGHAAAFSFYPGKNLGAFGDAGAVVTDDASLAARIRSIANHGRAAHSGHVHELLGRNSRLDALQAAVLRVKLPHLDGWNAGRRAAHRAYERLLAGSVVQMTAVHASAEHVHHLEVVQVPDRQAVVAELSAAGIGHGIHYPTPCHLHAPFAGSDRPSLPHVEAAAARIVSLPMYPTLDVAAVERVCDVVLHALR